MATVQVVLDGPLLKTADQIADRRHINRSALIREALRAHFRAPDIGTCLVGSIGSR